MREWRRGCAVHIESGVTLFMSDGAERTGTYMAGTSRPIKTAEEWAAGVVAPPIEGPLSDVPGLTPENAARWVDEKVAALQEEIDSLNAEIRLLRRRDESINYYMQRVDEE